MVILNRTWKTLGLLASAALMAWILYPRARRPELTVATVNNADMILMQQLSSEFEKQSGVKLNWVVLGENILRQRLTIDISTGSNTFDVITIGSYEAPLWGERGWLVPLDDLGADYGYDDIFDVMRQGLSYQGRMYAAPFYGESSFTYYRKDLFQKAGLEMPAPAELRTDPPVRAETARPGARRLRHLLARRAGLGPEYGLHQHAGQHVWRPLAGPRLETAAHQPSLGRSGEFLRRLAEQLWAAGRHHRRLQ